MSKNILFFTASPPGRIEARVVFNLYNTLIDSCCGFDSRLVCSLRDFFSLNGFFLFLKCDLIVVHTPFVHSFVLIFFAKIFRKKVLALVWDLYPVTIGGERYNKSQRRRVIDWIESLSLYIVDQVVVPTGDFLKFSSLKNAVAIGFWPPFIEEVVVRNIGLVSGPWVHVVFSGQINTTRGLVDAANYLHSIGSGLVKLLVVSPDPLPDELSKFDWVEYRGFLPPEQLVHIYEQCDFGLISLSVEFDGPAFPSKTFEYLKNGLPCLYFGPSLPNFLNSLQGTCVGFDMRSLSSIDEGLKESILLNFENKISKFHDDVCLSNYSFRIFLNIFDGLVR